VAFVVAETKAQAKDAAEAVELDIEPLPAVMEASAAAAPGAPRLYEELPGNIVLDFAAGDSARVAEAFARAAHITRLPIRNNRVVVSAMEPRSAIGSIEDGRFVLRVGCQGVHGLRQALAAQLRADPKDVRILTGNVGGSSG
jgi:carbon-monoxide dehydrogenase large subunit